MAGVQTFGNYIVGEWRPAASGETMENRNPANRDDRRSLRLVWRRRRRCRDRRRGRGVPGWRFSSPITRANILHKAANILDPASPRSGAS